MTYTPEQIEAAQDELWFHEIKIEDEGEAYYFQHYGADTQYPELQKAFDEIKALYDQAEQLIAETFQAFADKYGIVDEEF